MQFLSRSLKLFTAFGIPVKAHMSILVLLGLIAAMGSVYVPMYIILFASVIAHEFGHALTARRFGGDCKVIYMHVFGGAAMINIPRSLKAEWVVALAGPLTSLVLAGIFYALTVVTGLYYLWLAYVLNLMIGLFNLAPVYPMDGGRIFKTVTSYFLGEERGTMVAIWVARVIAAFAAVWGIYSGRYMFVLLSAFIVMFGSAEYNVMRINRGWK